MHRSNEYHKTKRLENPEHYKELDRKKYQRHCEKMKAYGKRARREDPQSYMFKQVKSRAKRLGIDFTITKEDIVIPEYCPILNIPLKIGEGKISPNSPSLDRVDNSLGYIPGNVRVISFKANRYKSDLSIDDIKNLLKYMENQ